MAVDQGIRRNAQVRQEKDAQVNAKGPRVTGAWPAVEQRAAPEVPNLQQVLHSIRGSVGIQSRCPVNLGYFDRIVGSVGRGVVADVAPTNVANSVATSEPAIIVKGWY